MSDPATEHLNMVEAKKALEEGITKLVTEFEQQYERTVVKSMRVERLSFSPSNLRGRAWVSTQTEPVR